MIPHLTPILVLLLQGLPVPQGSLGRLEGTVITGENLQPVPNARVTLSRKAGSGLVATSDDRGRFVFQGLTEGAYDVEAHAAGYAGNVTPIALSAGQIVRDFAVGVTAVANVSGRVRDTAGNPLVNASGLYID